MREIHVGEGSVCNGKKRRKSLKITCCEGGGEGVGEILVARSHVLATVGDELLNKT